MVQHDDFFKGVKPAAVLKHSVFTGYAHAFFSMVGWRHTGPMWLVDGYAGPGKYEADDSGDQVNGSPLVALEMAETQREFKPPRDIRCAFIEADPNLAAELRKNISPFQARGLHGDVHEGHVADRLPDAWKKVGTSPVLTFIDPFGVSSVSKATMTEVLLSRKHSRSEVMLNINVEAISRHGGYLQRDATGDAIVKPGLSPKGAERADDFFGGPWWRGAYLNADDRLRNGNRAAIEVVNQYRDMIHSETDASSVAVPIKRTRTGTTLFNLVLFYRHPAAGYKFADAAATGQRKWREVFRMKDLEEVRAAEEEMPSLFGADVMAAAAVSEAAQREKQLVDDAVANIEANIRRLLDPLAPGGSIHVAENVVAILGDYLSLAGEPAIRAAWDNLFKAKAVQKRDTSASRRMWDLRIVKQ